MRDDAIPFSSEDYRRVRLGVRVLGVVFFAVGIGQLVNAALRHDASTWIHGALVLAGAPIMAVVLWMLKHHRLEHAIFVACSTLLLLTIPGTKAQYAGPVVVCGPILIVALALPYLGRRKLLGLTVTAALINTVNVWIALFAPGPRVESGPIPAGVLYLFFASLVTALILFLLFQFSARTRDLRMAERTGLREVERLTALVRAVLRASPIAIVVLDKVDVIEVWNPACARLFAIAEDAAMGRALSDVLENNSPMRSLIERLHGGEHVDVQTLRAAPIGGAPLDLEIAAAPVIEDGSRAGSVLLLADVSLRKKLERDLIQAQRLETVGMLAGGIAHDFNNLLTIVTAEASLILDGRRPVDPKVGAGAIAAAATRASDLCKQLLSLSRRQIIQPKPHDLGGVLAEISPMLERMLGPTITLRIAVPNEPLVVEIDRSQFEQVVLNLAVNAKAAMPKGGPIDIGLAATDDAAVLTVRDTGAGMTEDVRARIFEPFFTTKGAGGTGLGLATVANVVRSALGSVDVVSSPGQGACFTCSFPRVVSKTGLAKSVPAALTHRGRHVLIVEDDPAIRNVLERILAASDCHVLSANDADEALVHLRGAARLDIMVTDVIMPGMNGRDLAEQAAALRPELSILFMSGYSTDPKLASMVADGSAHFLAKPFSRAQFENALDHVLRARVSTVHATGEAASVSSRA